jgi:hypothetical protein
VFNGFSDSVLHQDNLAVPTILRVGQDGQWDRFPTAKQWMGLKDFPSFSPIWFRLDIRVLFGDRILNVSGQI